MLFRTDIGSLSVERPCVCPSSLVSLDTPSTDALSTDPLSSYTGKRGGRERVVWRCRGFV